LRLTWLWYGGLGSGLLRLRLRLGQEQRPFLATTLQQQGKQKHNAGSAHGRSLRRKLDRQDYMTESEFNELADEVFKRIEQALDASGTDIEYSLTGGVLELEFEDGSKIIINRHGPNREIWLAAKSGGFHYSYKDGQWLSRRDGSELFGKLRELVKLGSGESVGF
jgi:CyaY protein